MVSMKKTAKDYYQRNKKSIAARRKAHRNSTVRGRMYAIYSNAKARAKKKKWDCDLTVDFLCALWDEQEGKCALTNDELSLAASDGKRWSGNTVSLDRIDSTLGYTQDNVWLVSMPVNYAKGVQTYEEFVEMCRKVVETDSG